MPELQQELAEKKIQIIFTRRKVRQSLLRVTALVALITAAGVLGRAAFQMIPSVEPLTPLAILAGLFFGPLAGAAAGASGFYFSNFLVWGGQGPWTLFQAAGAAAAGVIGGALGFASKSRASAVIATILGIIAYEFIVTAGLGFLMSFSVAFTALYIITSAPFSIVHLISSVGFAIAFYEFRDYVKKGSIESEKEVSVLRRAAGFSGDSPHKFVPVYRARGRGWKDSVSLRSRLRSFFHDEDTESE